MHHDDRLRLLERGVSFGGAWADLGCGEGAFTLALAQLVGHEDSVIHAVDRDARALNATARTLASRWPSLRVETYFADLAAPLDLPALDGALLGFTLGEMRDAGAVLKRVRGWLRPGGRLLVVDHDGDGVNPLVPFPCPWKRLRPLAVEAGFGRVELLGWVHSRFGPPAFGAVCDVGR